jgi:hypothetical protein
MLGVVRHRAVVAGLGVAVVVAVSCGPDGERNPPKQAPTYDVDAGSDALVASSSSSGGGGEAPLGGPIPDPDAPCDADLEAGEADPVAAAGAVELCKQASGTGWGVVSARWALPNGSDAPDVMTFDVGHGVLPAFGVVDPHRGERMLALSSGTARQPMDPDWMDPAGFDKGYASEHPAGFPKQSPSCPGVITGMPHDGIALEVTLRAPGEAAGFSFDFQFFTYEWPDYICSPFNDAFVALLSPPPQGQSDGNVSFDMDGNPISVNNALLSVCGCAAGPPCEAPPLTPLKTFDCPLGDDTLADTGFETRAATGWLVTKSPVEGGETIKLRWAIYDSADGILDSTVLIDDFTWLGGVDAGVVTEPDPPK